MGLGLDIVLEDLNAGQRAAVTAPSGHLLILAGAGSGKTRVLVSRIAWLVREHSIAPAAILAVTFTNKAAKEMQNRIEALLGSSARAVWIGTFHGLAHRLLRLHAQEAGLPETFQIVDSDDQLRLIKRIQKELNLDEDQYIPKQTQYYINRLKDEGKRAEGIPTPRDGRERTLAEVYRHYERHCQRAGYVDFSELLLRAKELWQKNPAVLQRYQTRFSAVLVDEFQDTNTLQYEWLKLLYAPGVDFMVVGDDDQSIYGWRGAQVDNMAHFRRDFPQVQLLKLEQNYRSTAVILEAANALIAQNTSRLGKSLWTDVDPGEKITLYQAANDLDEARYVVQQCRQRFDQGMPYSDMAVLYRANHQSRLFEEAVLRAGIPFRIYGGQRFFERAEIKDVLAYLRVLVHPEDEGALERIINWPLRGIGEKTVSDLRDRARSDQISLWEALKRSVTQGILKARAQTAMVEFIDLITGLQQHIVGLRLPEIVEHVILKSGLRNQYMQEKGNAGQARLENLDELITASHAFNTGEVLEASDTLGLSELSVFLAHTVLDSSLESGSDSSVNLMTLHSAKGLEFPVVFLAGLEEGLFPHQMCLAEPAQIEEERRLCYVGITRAKQKLYLSFAQKRWVRGEQRHYRSSRFLKELPAHQLDDVGDKTHIRLPDRARPCDPCDPVDPVDPWESSAFSPSDDAFCFKVGQRVKHVYFGPGVVTQCEQVGVRARVEVRFSQHGLKWLILGIAPLEPA